MDHKKDFEWLVQNKLGQDTAKAVEWSSPRLLCIAGGFTRYDESAVRQMNRNIELLRYRKFGNDLLMIELVHAPKVAKTPPKSSTLSDTDIGGVEIGTDKYHSQGYLIDSPTHLKIYVLYTMKLKHFSLIWATSRSKN